MFLTFCSLPSIITPLQQRVFFRERWKKGELSFLICLFFQLLWVGLMLPPIEPAESTFQIHTHLRPCRCPRLRKTPKTHYAREVISYSPSQATIVTGIHKGPLVLEPELKNLVLSSIVWWKLFKWKQSVSLMSEKRLIKNRKIVSNGRSINCCFLKLLLEKQQLISLHF